MSTILTLSKQAVKDLIIEPEVSSEAVYNQRFTAPIWPGGTSGITIGLGYDIGHQNQLQVQKDLAGLCSPAEIERISKYCGVIGIKCKQYLYDLRTFHFSWDKACKLFYYTSIKRYARMAANCYDELETLHPYEQTAIVGLVYNRGVSLKGDRRKEMVQLVHAIKEDDDKLMATLIRNMKRLWGEDQRGLRIRREKEAYYIEMVDTPIPDIDKLQIEI
jgi:hypothetical protein